jgi:hypothetical protein
MIRKGFFAKGLVCAILVANAAMTRAETKVNPYQEIARRNPFALRPLVVEPPVGPVEPPVLPPTEIKLTGITDLLGRLLVTLQYEDRQTRKVYYSPLLAEGQGDGTVTVVGIDAAKALVRIKQGQTETTLDFIRHGVQPSAVAVLPIPPVMPPVPLRPPLSREQTEVIERRRRELQEAFGQLPPGRGSAVILPSTRRDGDGQLRP